MMKLIIRGKEATVGMELTSFRGEKAKLISLREPHKASSSGRVYVELESGFKMECFPSVYGGNFVEE